MQKKNVTRLGTALMLSLSALMMGSLAMGCMSGAEPEDFVTEEAEESVGEAQQAIWVACYNTRPECAEICEEQGRLWKGKCKDSAYGDCVCMADIDNPPPWP